MTELLITQILTLYSLVPKEISPPQKGYRNESYRIELSHGNEVNLILYKNEKGIAARIKRANAVSDYLASKKFPTRHTIKSADGRSIIRLKGKATTRYACLYNYLPGETIPWEAYTMDHIKLLGKTMAVMHKELSAVSSQMSVVGNDYGHSLRVIPSVFEEMVVNLVRIEKYFSDTNVQNASKNKLKIELSFDKFKNLREKLSSYYIRTFAHSHILHMDFVRSNILFTNNEKLQSQSDHVGANNLLSEGDIAISGILDFEKTSYGPPIVDIARTLAFLIVDRKYKDEQKVRKYFLKSGYEKRGGLKTPALPAGREHEELLEDLLAFFWLYDFYKFLKHNPYEYLKQNEHFVRTKKCLRKLTILQLVH